MKPLGIADITKALANTEHPAWPALPDHWYWCRRHEEAEHASWPVYAVKCSACSERVIGKIGFLKSVGEFTHVCGANFTVQPGEEQECVRVGPFMSEGEANRLRGHSDDGRVIWDSALSMDIG